MIEYYMCKKTQVHKNQLSLHHFYIQVLELVCDQLQTLHKRKYASKEWKFDQDVLYNIREGTKYYLQNQKEWFARCIQHREGRHQENRIRKIFKCKQIDIDMVSFPNTVQQTQKQVVSQLKLNPRQYIQQVQRDLGSQNYLRRISDIRQYYYQHTLPQYDNNQENKLYKQQKQQQNSQSTSSLNDSIVDTVRDAQNAAGALLFGNFSTTNHFKFKSKEGKVLIQLQNVFIKFADQGRDALYLKVELQLLKKDKDMIPELLRQSEVKPQDKIEEQQ